MISRNFLMDIASFVFFKDDAGHQVVEESRQDADDVHRPSAGQPGYAKKLDRDGDGVACER
jgi:hypothetical protein